jgi:hypothetical protein
MYMVLIEVFQQHMRHQCIHFHLVCTKIRKRKCHMKESFQQSQRVIKNNNNKTGIKLSVCVIFYS